MSEPTQTGPATPGMLRRLLNRVTSTSEEADAVLLQREAYDRGATPVAGCCTGEQVTVSGTLRALTLRPVGGGSVASIPAGGCRRAAGSPCRTAAR